MSERLYKGKFTITLYDADGFLAYMADNIAELCRILGINAYDPAERNRLGVRIRQASKKSCAIIVNGTKYEVHLIKMIK